MQKLIFCNFWSSKKYVFVLLKMSKNVFWVVAQLPQRLKLTLFQIFSNGAATKMRPELWKSHIVQHVYVFNSTTYALLSFAAFLLFKKGQNADVGQRGLGRIRRYCGLGSKAGTYWSRWQAFAQQASGWRMPKAYVYYYYLGRDHVQVNWKHKSIGNISQLETWSSPY